MAKTIEEAAKEAIIANDFFMADPNYPEFVDRGLEQMRACKWVINHIFSLPLASRLTAEEKERVRKMYKELSECIENRTADVEYLKGKRCQLVIIFGADFFKEGE